MLFRSHSLINHQIQISCSTLLFVKIKVANPEAVVKLVSKIAFPILTITSSIDDLLLLFGVAILGTFGHYFMTMALSLAPLSVTQPVIFFQLIWSTLIGLLLFGESLDIFILIGGSFIVVAIVQLSSNEKLIKKNPLEKLF